MKKKEEKPKRHEGWKVTGRTVTKDDSGVGLERIERVRTAGILKKLSHAFLDELSKIANGDDDNKGGTPSEESVIQFLQRHPRPGDKAFHEWAEHAGYNVHKAEATAYRILSDLLNKGKSKGKMPAGMGGEIPQGVGVEKEHTPNPLIARKIVADHLSETGKGYYPGLHKLEKRLTKG